MIYITEKNFERQLALLQLVSQLSGATDLVAWLYPGLNLTSFVGLEVTSDSDGLLPVTTYEDDSEKVSNTMPTQFTSSLAERLVQGGSEIFRCCDSLAIYRKDEKDWYACTIYHEGMCLVSDNILLSHLIAQGFNATEEAPTWR
ncbi:MAG: hypothetical protein OEW08_07505 [Gammaproteobacteria bacterium]|nr:hypothetical protein [Gammaproteobacteria bacterium]